jgi:UDP-N-acetylmuramoylalanine--D-glutamate ligase
VKAVRAAGVPIIAEAQFGLDHMQTSIVAVTGTNGKSTVTQTAADVLRASGKNAVAAGNIGTPMSEVAENGVEYDVVVAELSSFQLDMMDIHPTAATILNIAPDHLDWHGSFDAYVAAKASVLDQMVDDDVFVSNADDDLVTSIAASAKCRVVAASGFRVPPDGNGVDGQTIVIGSHRYPAPIEDPSYRFDLVVAATLASVVGATPDGIGKIIAAFEPGQHRRNLVAVVDGVRWINDSKGTNPHATVAAASAYDRVRLLVGGRNKDLDLSPISRIENLAGLYAFGEAGPDIAKDAVGVVTVHASMEDAMRAAANDAQPGDVVLLSPGCTSFDEFTSYAERGARFAQIVHTMEGGSGR